MITMFGGVGGDDGGDNSDNYGEQQQEQSSGSSTSSTSSTSTGNRISRRTRRRRRQQQLLHGDRGSSSSSAVIIMPAPRASTTTVIAIHNNMLILVVLLLVSTIIQEPTMTVVVVDAYPTAAGSCSGVRGSVVPSDSQQTVHTGGPGAVMQPTQGAEEIGTAVIESNLQTAGYSISYWSPAEKQGGQLNAQEEENEQPAAVLLKQDTSYTLYLQAEPDADQEPLPFKGFLFRLAPADDKSETIIDTTTYLSVVKGGESQSQLANTCLGINLGGISHVNSNPKRIMAVEMYVDSVEENQEDTRTDSRTKNNNAMKVGDNSLKEANENIMVDDKVIEELEDCVEEEEELEKELLEEEEEGEGEFEELGGNDDGGDDDDEEEEDNDGSTREESSGGGIRLTPGRQRRPGRQRPNNEDEDGGESLRRRRQLQQGQGDDGLLLLPPIPKVLADICLAAKTDGNSMVQCRNMCARYMCCYYPESHEESCLKNRNNHFTCLQIYQECSTIVTQPRAIDPNKFQLLSNPPANLPKICSANSIKTKAGKNKCRNACYSNAKCCFVDNENDKDSKNSLLIAKIKVEESNSLWPSDPNIDGGGGESTTATQLVSCQDLEQCTKEYAACFNLFLEVEEEEKLPIPKKEEENPTEPKNKKKKNNSKKECIPTKKTPGDSDAGNNNMNNRNLQQQNQQIKLNLQVTIVFENNLNTQGTWVSEWAHSSYDLIFEKKESSQPSSTTTAAPTTKPGTATTSAPTRIPTAVPTTPTGGEDSSKTTTAPTTSSGGGGVGGPPNSDWVKRDVTIEQIAVYYGNVSTNFIEPEQVQYIFEITKLWFERSYDLSRQPINASPDVVEIDDDGTKILVPTNPAFSGILSMITNFTYIGQQEQVDTATNVNGIELYYSQYLSYYEYDDDNADNGILNGEQQLPFYSFTPSELILMPYDYNRSNTILVEMLRSEVSGFEGLAAPHSIPNIPAVGDGDGSSPTDIPTTTDNTQAPSPSSPVVGDGTDIPYTKCWSNLTAIYYDLEEKPANSKNITYVICPGKTYDIGYTDLFGFCCVDGYYPLTARSYTKYICGDGSRSSGCVLRGGSSQVRISNKQFDIVEENDDEIVDAVFQGFTFSAPQRTTTFAAAKGTVSFVDCTFENQSNEGPVLAQYSHNSINSDGSRQQPTTTSKMELVFDRCIFRNNTQGPKPLGIYVPTYGIVSATTPDNVLVFQDCIFMDNEYATTTTMDDGSSMGAGYAISVLQGSQVTIKDTCFLNNNLTGTGTVEVFDSGYVESESSYGTPINNNLSCQFIAYSQTSPTEDVECIEYTASTCTARIYEEGMIAPTRAPGRGTTTPTSDETADPSGMFNPTLEPQPTISPYPIAEPEPIGSPYPTAEPESTGSPYPTTVTEEPDPISSLDPTTVVPTTTTGDDDVVKPATSLMEACSICPPGSTISKPERNLVIRDITCGALQTFLNLLQDDAECLSYLGATPFVELSSFCGCTSVSPPNLCQVCSNGGELLPTEADGSKEVAIPGLDKNLNCEQASLIAPYITQSWICGSVPFAVDPLCCSAPVRPKCSVCPEDSTMQRPNEEVLLAYGLKCSELEDDEQTCEVLNNANDVYDVASYCGCTGTTLPNLCSACGDGESVSEEDAEKMVLIPRFNKEFKCEAAVALPMFASDKIVCSEMVSAIRDECCSDPTVSDSSSSSTFSSFTFMTAIVTLTTTMMLLFAKHS